MKFKNKLNLKSEKVLLGLFALLFVSSFATTGFILKQDKVANNANKNQLAQIGPDIVGPEALSRDCISLKPVERSTQVLFSFAPLFLPDNAYFDKETKFEITNTCRYDIKIIDPRTLRRRTPQEIVFQNMAPHTVMVLRDLVSQGIQIKSSSNGPYPYIDLQDSNTNISAINDTDKMNCQSCGANGTASYFSLLAQDGESTLKTYNLNAGETKQFVMIAQLNIPENSTFRFRVTLRNVKWLRASDALDNYITEEEVKTHVLSLEESDLLASDFISIQHVPEYSGFSGEGSNLQIDNPELFKQLQNYYQKQSEVLKEKALQSDSTLKKS